MSSIIDSKDIILAFFGLFLSLVFSQGLFPRIVTFVHEFARSVIPFGYQFQLLKDETLTKEKAAKLHSFKVDRAKKLSSLTKSINCNTSVAMTVMVVAVTAVSFKLVGIPISFLAIAWGMLLTVAFVYASYFLWATVKDRSYWGELPAMSSSKFNLLLSIEVVLLVLYSALTARGIFNYWVFVALGLLVIYTSVRLHRIPHINVTHRRAKEFQENEEFYLMDILKETIVITAVFLVLFGANETVYPILKFSYIGAYIEVHPVRTFSLIFLIPFIVLAVRFLQVVGGRSVLRFMVFIHRPDLPF